MRVTGSARKVLCSRIRENSERLGLARSLTTSATVEIACL